MVDICLQYCNVRISLFVRLYNCASQIKRSQFKSILLLVKLLRASDLFSLGEYSWQMTRSRCRLQLSPDIYHHPHSQERQSTETRIVLKSVKLNSEGSYLCEVSGEAPLFQTAKNQNFLKVVGNKWRLTRRCHDDSVMVMTILFQIFLTTAPWYQAACPATRSGMSSLPTVPLSIPSRQRGSTGQSATFLMFVYIWNNKMLPRYINGEEATSAMLIQYPVTEDFRGRLTSVLGLR